MSFSAPAAEVKEVDCCDVAVRCNGTHGLLLSRKEVGALEAGKDLFHAVHHAAGEVDQFQVEPVINGRLVRSGGMLHRAQEVRGEVDGEWLQREQRRQSCWGIAAERVVQLRERPSA